MSEKAQRVTLSVFDRLIEPEVDALPAANVERLRKAVCRDLENLLNTHAPLWVLPPECREVSTSVASYGLPDYTGPADSVDARREMIRRQITRLIETYEPRLSRVRVEVRRGEADRRALHLRIESILRADPVVEPIVFDSILKTVGTGVDVMVNADG